MQLILLVLILLFLPLSASAEGVWTHYSSANTVIDIFCKGEYVWLATNNGVVKRNRLDGSFMHYTVSDGLPHEIVRRVFVDSKGVQWFATDGGLARLDGNTLTTLREVQGFPLTDIRCMTEDRDGIMWFGTASNGVFCFDGMVWKQYTASDGLDAAGAGDVEVDTDNVKWFAVSYGIASYDGKTWKKYTQAYGDIAVDRNGVKWFAAGKSLISFDGVRFTEYPLGFEDTILSVAIDESGVKWINTHWGKVGGFDGNEWHWLPEMYAVDELMLTIGRIAVDTDGNKWVSPCVLNAYEFGVACFDGTSWKRYKVDDGPAANTIMTIGVDNENRKYFGTFYQGLSCFDGKTWTTPFIRDENVYEFLTIAFDHDNVMWLSIRPNKGLISIDGNNRKIYNYPDGPMGGVNAIAIGQDNTKWFATSNGVSSFNGKEWKNWSEEDGLADNEANSIAVDNNNVVWVGSYTFGNGLSSFDGNSWKTYTLPDGSSDPPVYSLVVDKNNIKWFSFGNYGVYRFDGISWERVTREDGTRVTAGIILVDLNNVKWFVGDKDVDRYDGATWETYQVIPPNYIESISCAAVDRNNVKWFASWGMGVFSFDDRTSTLVQENVPASYALSSHPNPFNPSTAITFILPAPGRATLAVYSITGQKIRELVSGQLPVGTYSVVWDGKNAGGQAVASGVYFSRLEIHERSETRKMLLMR